MKNRFYIMLIISLFGFMSLKYNDSGKIINQSPEERAEKLLAKLSLGEKVAQLKNYSYEFIRNFVDVQGNVNPDSLKKYFPHGIGGISVSNELEPAIYLQVVNSISKYNKTAGHGIPALFVGEGLHGFMARGATVFPQAIALGCSWDTDLLERIYSATALEASSRGVKQLLSPVLDLGREPRFGRTEEMFSEDAYLVSECGKSAVYGFQGRSGNPDSNHVAATLKHFVGHGIPEGGRNIAPVNISYYDLMNTHMQPFETCVKAGVLSVMPSYNEVNGLPNHANKWLLRDLLRGKFGFKGLITADQNAIDEMYRTHLVATNAGAAAKLAIENGVDVDLRYTSGTYDELENLVKNGQLNIKYINESVKRILTLKFRLGLFENKEFNQERMLEVTNCKAHKDLAFEAAYKSLVLLKNDNNMLPFDENKIKSIAVIGPFAKGVYFGGYTAEPVHGTDVLTGIEMLSNNKFKVAYAEGCKISKEAPSFWKNEVQVPNDESSDSLLISEAVALAEKSDAVVLTLGEHVSFCREAWAENHLGDRESLDLLGRQNLLVEKLIETGKPIVVLMFGGRPLSFNYVSEKVPGIIQVFYPGQEGGKAIANVLFGKVNPSGKLSITIPKSVGQLPCYYSRKPSRMRSYIYFEGNAPLYPFGFGLSYTNYTYSDITLDKTEIPANGTVNASINVTNTGKMEGEEIVQLYIHDLVSKSVRPIIELKDFKRIRLKPGETKTITFTINKEKLEYYNSEFVKVAEPGEFEVMIGPNSIYLKKIKFTLS